MLEDDGALAAEMLVQGNSVGRASQEAEPMLAVLYRCPSQILAVDLKKVEGTQDYARNGCGRAGLARMRQGPCRRRQSLAIQAGPPRQGGNGGRSQRKPSGKIISVAGNKPDTGAVAPGHDTKAVMLDFVNPAGADGGRLGGRRQTRFYEADKTTLTQQNHDG
jgi:hypothetical protein